MKVRIPFFLNQKGGPILSQKEKRRRVDRRELRAKLKRWQED